MATDRHELWIILLIVLLSFLGSSIAYPIFPPLFLTPNSHSIIPVDWSLNWRSIFLGVALAAYPLGQFFGSPILGGCSDRYGRKKILVITLVGCWLGNLLTAFALQWHILWLLLASRLLTGFVEGNIAIVRAMATDLSSISKYKSIGRINSIGSIGYIIGPLLGGFLSDSNLSTYFSYALPFYFATLFTVIAWVLTLVCIREKSLNTHSPVNILERFNIFTRFKTLFASSNALKQLLVVSTLFTLAVDIFYEFGPIYLTGVWGMAPADIAVYTATLAFTLALSSAFIPAFLSRFQSIERIIFAAMFMTAVMFGVLTGLHSLNMIFVFFALIGIGIATTTTNLTIQISNVASHQTQGEAFGTQLSLRTLGDAVICLLGSFLVISSFLLPLILCCIVALVALGLYYFHFFRVGKSKLAPGIETE